VFEEKCKIRYERRCRSEYACPAGQKSAGGAVKRVSVCGEIRTSCYAHPVRECAKMPSSRQCRRVPRTQRKRRPGQRCAPYESDGKPSFRNCSEVTPLHLLVEEGPNALADIIPKVKKELTGKRCCLQSPYLGYG